MKKRSSKKFSFKLHEDANLLTRCSSQVAGLKVVLLRKHSAEAQLIY